MQYNGVIKIMSKPVAMPYFIPATKNCKICSFPPLYITRVSKSKVSDFMENTLLEKLIQDYAPNEDNGDDNLAIATNILIPNLCNPSISPLENQKTFTFKDRDLELTFDKEINSLYAKVIQESGISAKEIENDIILTGCFMEAMKMKITPYFEIFKKVLKEKSDKIYQNIVSHICNKGVICFDDCTQTEEFDFINYKEIKASVGNILTYVSTPKIIRSININASINGITVYEGEYEKKAIKEEESSEFISLIKTTKEEALLFQKQIPKIISGNEFTTHNLAYIRSSINTLSEIYISLVEKLCQLEKDIVYLTNKKELAEITSKASISIDITAKQYANIWKEGYGRGFHSAIQYGILKGSCETKDIYMQKGFFEGIVEGWQIGFDKGHRVTMKKVGRVASQYKINLSTLGIDNEIANEEFINKQKKDLQTRVFKRTQKIEKAREYGFISKVSKYNDKKVVQYGLISIVNLLKFIINILSQYNKKASKEEDLLQFLIKQSTKIYIVSSLVDRRVKNVICSTSRHSKISLLVELFGKFLGIFKCGYCIHILKIVAKYMMLIQKYSIDYNIDIEPFPSSKAYEMAISALPDISKEAQFNLHNKMIINHPKDIECGIALKNIIDTAVAFLYPNSSKHEIWFNAMTLLTRNYVTLSELHLLFCAFNIYTVSFYVDGKDYGMPTHVLIDKIKKSCCNVSRGRYIVHYKDIDAIASNSTIFQSDYCDRIFRLIEHPQDIHQYVKDAILRIEKLLSSFSYSPDNFGPATDWSEKLNFIREMCGCYNPRLVSAHLLFLEKGLANGKDRTIEVSDNASYDSANSIFESMVGSNDEYVD